VLALSILALKLASLKKTNTKQPLQG